MVCSYLWFLVSVLTAGTYSSRAPWGWGQQHLWMYRNGSDKLLLQGSKWKDGQPSPELPRAHSSSSAKMVTNGSYEFWGYYWDLLKVRECLLFTPGNVAVVPVGLLNSFAHVWMGHVGLPGSWEGIGSGRKSCHHLYPFAGPILASSCPIPPSPCLPTPTANNLTSGQCCWSACWSSHLCWETAPTVAGCHKSVWWHIYDTWSWWYVCTTSNRALRIGLLAC